jgi:DNA invertase Pin-like site-specific DNA recombinase
LIPRPIQITQFHLDRLFVNYVRQSSDEQVRENVGSLEVQRQGLAFGEAWGWPSNRTRLMEDLGVSGSVPGLRPAFNEMLAMMSRSEVGVVNVSDISRLGRNPRDLVAFAEAARDCDVLLRHGGQVVDFRDPNAEFTAMFFGLNAGREQRVRTGDLTRGRRAKAEKGHAVTRPPAGIEVTRRPARFDGIASQFEPTRDPQTRDAIALVFAKFFELGSLGQVVRFFTATERLLPRRQPNGAIAWRPATRAAVYAILTNPAYAGIYVYGKTSTQGSSSRNKRGHRGQVPQPRSNWVWLPGNHEGYITPAQGQAIRERLRANRWQVRQPPGRGEALLQGGVLKCRVHCRSFVTRYPRRVRRDGEVRRVATYFCMPGRDKCDATVCTQIVARHLDEVIEAKILAALVPPSDEFLEQARREAMREHESLRRHRESELLVATRKVAELQQALDTTLSEHLHVRQHFAARLESEARRLDDLKAAYAERPLVAPLTMSAAELADLRRLTQDIRQLWRNGAISADRRKRIVRQLIQGVFLTPGNIEPRVEIQWAFGGSTSCRLPTRERVRVVVAEARGKSMTEEQIVAELRERGLCRTYGQQTGQPYTVRDVRRLLGRMQLIPAHNEASYALIRQRVLEGVGDDAIAEELKGAGLRHGRGPWTAARVALAVKRLQRGRVGRVPRLTQKEIAACRR